MTARATWALAGLTLLASAGCGQARAGGGAAGVVVDHASPLALARSLHAAVGARDYGAVVEAVEPPARSAYAILLEGVDEYTRKTLATARLLEDRVGAESAERFRRLAMMKVDVLPFTDPAVGDVVRWERVTVTESGDQALVRLGDRYATSFLLRNIASQWYLAAPAAPSGTLRDQAKATRALYRKAGKMIDDIARDIRRGQIDRDNVETRLLAPMLGRL